MKIGAGYIPLESRYPLRGLNSSVPSTQLDPSFSPSLNNMQIREGVVFKRSGYYELDDTLTMVGDVLATTDFQKLDDTRILIALTSKRQYKLIAGTGWTDITAVQSQHAIKEADTGSDFFKISDDHTALFLVGSKFTVIGSTGNNATYIVTVVAFSGGQTQIDVAAVPDATADGFINGVEYPIIAVTSGINGTFTIDGDIQTLFGAGVKFVIEGSTGNDAEYTVVSVTLTAGDTVITVSSVPDGTVDGTIFRIQELTTIEGDYIDWVIGTDNSTHKIYMTNGRDRPRFWDGTTSRFLLWHPEFTGFTTCRTLEVFFDYLVLGNYTLAGTNVKFVAWSDVAEFETFNTGDSGTLLIPGISGQILRLDPLGDRLMIYSADTIAALIFLGGSIVFASQIILRDTRLVSAQSMVNIGPAHLFAAQENIYFFDGTRSTRPVGDVIRDFYKRDLDFEFGARLFMFNDVARRLVFIVVPTTAVISSTRSIVYVLDYNVFDLNQFIWTRIEYNDRPHSLGFFARRTAPDWDDPPDNPWNEEVGIWDDESERINFPVRVMGSGSKVHLLDETQRDDDDTATTGLYETLDFVVPIADQSALGRWGEIEADLAGAEVKVYYSTDQGRLWTLVETQALLGEFQQYHFPIDTTSRTLRVKFESTDYFSLRWIRVWVRPEGPR